MFSLGFLCHFFKLSLNILRHFYQIYPNLFEIGDISTPISNWDIGPEQSQRVIAPPQTKIPSRCKQALCSVLGFQDIVKIKLKIVIAVQ